MFEAQSREVSQMTLVLFLISSAHSLGELEEVCVHWLLSHFWKRNSPPTEEPLNFWAHEWPGEGTENTFAFYG